MGERMVLRHCRLAIEADSPTSRARGGLSIRPLDSRIKIVTAEARTERVFEFPRPSVGVRTRKSQRLPRT
jgi:hypothetical protein